MHEFINCPRCSELSLSPDTNLLELHVRLEKPVLMQLTKVEIKKIGRRGPKFREGRYRCPVCGHKEIVLEF